jgi:hypothetical protein
MSNSLHSGLCTIEHYKVNIYKAYIFEIPKYYQHSKEEAWRYGVNVDELLTGGVNVDELLTSGVNVMAMGLGGELLHDVGASDKPAFRSSM